MSYKKKKMEAKADLKRYYSMLPDTEDMEDREFFISGIINIDLKYRNERIFRRMDTERMRQKIADSVYNLEAIANFCTVSLKDIKHVLAGRIPKSKTLKKIHVGLKAYGI